MKFRKGDPSEGGLATQVVFRLDGGGASGFGHARRCISLARNLEATYNQKTLFVSNSHPALEELYEREQVEALFSESEIDESTLLIEVAEKYAGAVLVVDTLREYEPSLIDRLRNHVRVVMIHNVCGGMYAADAVIFPVAHLARGLEYGLRKFRGRTRFYVGRDYVMINERARTTPAAENGNYLAITTGASDPRLVMITLLDWLAESAWEIPVKALYGVDFQDLETLLERRSRYPTSIQIAQFDYETLFGASLALSTFGVTPYELIHRNVPVMTVGHQPKNAQASDRLADRYGANLSLGLIDRLDGATFIRTLESTWCSGVRHRIMRKQEGLIDGKGIDRAARIIHDLQIDKSVGDGN